VAHLQTDSANGWACQFDEVPTTYARLAQRNLRCAALTSFGSHAQEKIVSNGENEVRLWDFRTLELRQTFKAVDSIRFLRYDDTKLVAYLCTHTHFLFSLYARGGSG